MTFLVSQILAYLLAAAMLGGLVVYGASTRTRRRAERSSELELHAHQEELASLQTRLDTLQTGRREQETRALDLQAQLHELQAQYEHVSRERDEHRGTLAAVAGSHQSDLGELRRVQKQTEDRLANEIMRHEAQMAQLRTERQALAEQLETQRAAQLDHEGRAQAVEDRLQTLNGTHASQLAELNARLLRAEDERDQHAARLTDAMQAAQATLKEQDGVLQALRASREHLEEELVQARQDRDASATLAQRVQGEVARLERALTEVRQEQDDRLVSVRDELTRARAEQDEEQQRRRQREAELEAGALASAREREAEARAEVARLTEELATARRGGEPVPVAPAWATAAVGAAAFWGEDTDDEPAHDAPTEEYVGDRQGIEHPAGSTANGSGTLEPPRDPRDEVAEPSSGEADSALARLLGGSVQDAIRARAYAIWVSEGKPPDRDTQIWLQAEAEVARARSMA